MDAAKDRGLEIHLSTQASVSNSRGIVRYYRNDGIKRFVLARECTLEHIKLIRSNLRNELGAEADRIELETFIHGAMCVSVSGRCFMSESATGESGNRGACLQPCRREYRIIDVEGEYEFEIGRDYVMSPRDLCTMPFLEKILEAPIASLKIEGRMRSPEYAAVVVGSYRKAVDFYFDNIESFRARNAVLSGADGGGAVPEENPGGGRNQHDLYSEFEDLKVSLTEELKNVFNRGFYSGYFMGRPVGEWAKTGNSQARMKKETVGAVTNYYQKIGVAEILVQGASFSVGDELVIQGPTTGNMFVKVGSIQVDHASVDKAEKGSRVALKVPGRVRLSDSVFRRFPV
jgi:putative protease